MPTLNRVPGHCEIAVERRVRHASSRLNPALRPEAIEDAYHRLHRLSP